MHDLLADYLRHLAFEKNASAHTVKSYREDLNQAVGFFEGIGENEPIGDFPSLVLNAGAAGFELDRVDYTLGSPSHTLILGTASGFSDNYQHVIEEVTLMGNKQGGTTHPLVKADLAHAELQHSAYRGGECHNADHIRRSCFFTFRNAGPDDAIEGDQVDDAATELVWCVRERIAGCDQGSGAIRRVKLVAREGEEIDGVVRSAAAHVDSAMGYQLRCVNKNACSVPVCQTRKIVDGWRIA